MSAILKNFVTVRKTTGDVLNPAEYRTIVEMIRGILKRYDFTGLNKDYQRLLAHLTDYNDPHKDSRISFFNEIVEKTYNNYVNMVERPLSLTQFKDQIVPTLGFIELIRRIVLNRYLYNQVKTSTGAVPFSSSAYLSEDWGVFGVQTSPTQLFFANNINSEEDFVKLGWGANSSPIATIFNANSLTDTLTKLPVIYETSSSGASTPQSSIGVGFPIPLALSSNDLTITLTAVGTPTSTTTLFSLRNGGDTFKIIINRDKVISVSLNNVVVTQSISAGNDGRIEVAISRKGILSLTTYKNNIASTRFSGFVFTNDAPFTTGLIGVGTESLFTSAFALRDLVIYRGYTQNFVELEIDVPDGYALLTDPDGAYLVDEDGVPLMDVYVPITGIIPPNGFIILTDDDGVCLTDPDGFILIEPIGPIAKPGYIFLVDDDGVYLVDDDGFYLTELIGESLLPPGYAFIIDEDGSYVIDTDGTYLIEQIVKVDIPAGYRFIIDNDGVYLTDSDGAFLIEKLPLLPPAGYTFITDDDGSYVVDDDGKYLVEFIESALPTLPVGCAFVINREGKYVIDRNGKYVISRVDNSPFELPPQYVFVKDKTGAFMTDRDGAFLVDYKYLPPFDDFTLPEGMVFLKDDDGRLVIDDDGLPLYDLEEAG